MKILVSEFMDRAGLEVLARAARVEYRPELWRDGEALRRAAADAAALVVRNRTRVDEGLLAAAPALRVVGRLGVGLDNLDLAAARRRGVRVVYARNANAVAVAEYVFAALLTFVRDLAGATAHVRAGGWDRQAFTGRELYGKTLGLVGVGEIGTRVALRARAFGMTVVGHDPFLPPYELAAVDLGVELLPLEEVLARADFLSVHVPLTPATAGLLGGRELALVKPGAFLVNTSRGQVVDEEALAAALRAGRLAGAALDVFAAEPPAGSPLLELPNVVLTPHVAGLTVEAQERTGVLVAAEVLRVLAGEEARCLAV